MIKRIAGLTLIELLIAIILLSIIVLGITSIDIFSHFHVIGADRRARLQNEVSIGLEHMNREILQAFGNEIINGVDSVVYLTINNPNTNNNRIRFRVDNNNDGVADIWRAYIYRTVLAERYQIWFCPQCNSQVCIWGIGPSGCNSAVGGWQRISRNIVRFEPIEPSNPLQDNYITINIAACWNPANPPDLSIFPNGTVDNPCVRMTGRVMMPSVSTN